MKKSFDKPARLTKLPKIRVVSGRIGDLDVRRLTVEPGWRWSDSVGPAMSSDTCPLEHFVWIVTAGRFCVRMDDGRTEEFGPGDVGSIDRGHDAWVVGDDVVVGFDVQAAADTSG